MKKYTFGVFNSSEQVSVNLLLDEKIGEELIAQVDKLPYKSGDLKVFAREIVAPSDVYVSRDTPSSH